jgi:uncharacterized OB-fold protein
MTVILPYTDERDTEGFWAAARERRLVVQKCAACGHLRFPPHPYCPKCRSNAVGWQTMSGRGRIWSFVVAHKPTLPAFADFVPYPVAIIELDDEPRLRMTGNIVASPDAPINSVDPARLAIGQKVQVAFTQVADDVVLPRWVLA